MSFRAEDPGGHRIWGFANYHNFFQEPIYWLTFVRTAVYSILVTFLTVRDRPAGGLLHHQGSPAPVPGFLLTLLLLLPFWVSELVRVYGWMILLRESGVINHFLLKAGLLNQPVEMLYNDVTMVMGLVYTSMLFMVVPLVSVLDSLDDSLIEAAYDLGGNLWSILFRIIIPHATPGNRVRIHRGLHAHPGQLPHAQSHGGQELALVHRADLQPVHRQLQLEPGLGLRLSAAGPLLPGGLAGTRS